MSIKLKLGLFSCITCAFLYMFYAYIATSEVPRDDSMLALRKQALLDDDTWQTFRLPLHKPESKGDAQGEKQPAKDALQGVTSFVEALERVASPERSVVLTLVDQEFHAMAINFYLTCVKPWGLRHYLVLTMHPDTCGLLAPHGIQCFLFKEQAAGDAASAWGTQLFKDKMNVRTEFLLQALAANFSVLHTDIDMYCFQDMMAAAALSCPPHSCDIAPLMDTSSYNAGFLFINPSPASIRVYERMTAIAKKNPAMDDQAQLNKAMHEQGSSPGGLRVTRLPKDQYFCGLTFYETPKRYFAESAAPCPKCVVVHNNWIVSMQAKTYRAKEMQQWVYDGDNGGGYYTDPHAKYLRYTTSNSSEHNVQALKAALAIAQILNRTLILPAFSSPSGSPVPLLSVLRVAAFDAEFAYREHSFSTHPSVPAAVTASCSPVYVLATDAVPADVLEQAASKETPRVLTAADQARGMTDAEIRRHLGAVPHAILQLYVPHNAFAAFLDAATERAWQDKCSRGLKPGAYRQYG